MNTTPYESKEITCKSALVKCGIPGIDFVINPYIGCRFGCTYCYASFMGRFLKGVDIKDWGNYVYAKVNLPEVLKTELKSKLKNKGRGLEVFLSSVTDCYQGAEAKYKLTRQSLEILADFGFEGVLSILTKSMLVTRDIDVLKRFKHAVVGFTITSTDDKISRYFEKYAPNVSDRFAALKKLNEAGITTYAFLGPLLPHFVAQKDELEKIFIKLNEVGTKDIYVEHLNLSGYIKGRLFSEMGWGSVVSNPHSNEPRLRGENWDLKGIPNPRKVGFGMTDRIGKLYSARQFYASQDPSYREALDQEIRRLVKKYNMNLLMDMVIYHKEFQKLSDAKAKR